MSLRGARNTLIAVLALGSGLGQEIDPGEFRRHLQSVAGKVPEFSFLREAAQKYDLKIWLFGGAASSFAHYVKDRILWQRGEEGYYAFAFAETSRGELDMTNIFRPTQDIDLVVDGSLENVRDFEQVILSFLPDLRGDGKTWEVRTLREEYHGKPALLDNFDFLNQHTDSHSVGMVALNDVPVDEMVRDLRDWDSFNNSQFLTAVLAGRLHYYYSESHEQTSRFGEGKNPPVFSVIRALIKIFQHELAVTDKVEGKMKSIIAQFNSNSIDDSYVRYWLSNNVPKLFLYSRDIEYSWDKLEQLGLRQKLLQIGDVNRKYSVAWWMNKEPLRSFAIGKGSGQTAASLDIKQFVYDAKDFSQWTMIASSRSGRANMFISEQGVAGEFSISGSNGLKVVYSVDPRARVGSDFIILGDVVFILNNNAIQLIPESLDIGGIADYFRLLGSDLSASKILIEKIKIRIDRYYFYQQENPEVKLEISQVIDFLHKSKNEQLWEKWFQLKVSNSYPELVKDAALHLSQDDFFALITRSILTHRRQGDRSQWIEVVLQEVGRDNLWDIARHIQLLGMDDVLDEIAGYISHQSHWAEVAGVIRPFLEEKSPREKLVASLLKQLVNENNPREISRIVTEIGQYRYREVFASLLAQIENQLKNERLNTYVMSVTFKSMAKIGNAEALGYLETKIGSENIVSTLQNRLPAKIAAHIVNGFEKSKNQMARANHDLPFLFYSNNKPASTLVENEQAGGSFLGHLRQVFSRNTPSRGGVPFPLPVSLPDNQQGFARDGVQRVLRGLEWSVDLDSVLRSGDDQLLARFVRERLLLSNITHEADSLAEIASGVRKIIERGGDETLTLIAREVLTQEAWAPYPELMELLVRYGSPSVHNTIEVHTLRASHWRTNERLREISDGREATVDSILRGINKKQGC